MFHSHKGITGRHTLKVGEANRAVMYPPVIFLCVDLILYAQWLRG